MKTFQNGITQPAPQSTEIGKACQSTRFLLSVSFDRPYPCVSVRESHSYVFVHPPHATRSNHLDGAIRKRTRVERKVCLLRESIRQERQRLVGNDVLAAIHIDPSRWRRLQQLVNDGSVAVEHFLRFGPSHIWRLTLLADRQCNIPIVPSSTPMAVEDVRRPLRCFYCQASTFSVIPTVSFKPFTVTIR